MAGTGTGFSSGFSTGFRVGPDFSSAFSSAFNVDAAAPGVSIPVLMHHYMQQEGDNVRPIKKATTNVSSVVRIIDSTAGTPETGVTSATAGLAFNYRREGAAAVAITAINDLAALTTAHTDGGIKHIGDGYYRVDFQDAAYAAGADGVLLTGTATGMIVIGTYHPLVDYDPYDSVRLGMTALPNAAAAAAGGLPTSTAGSLEMDTLADWVNGGRLDLIIDQVLADTNELQTDDVPGLITALNDPTAATIADAVWDEAATGHTDAGKAGEQLWTDIDAVLVDTAEIGAAGAGLTEAGGTGDQLTALATAANLATVDGIVDDILVDTGTTLPATLTDMQGATFNTSTDSLEALRDRGDAAWTTGAGGTPPDLLQSTTIATLATQTSFTLTAGSADNDAYNGQVAIITDSATSEQKAVATISDYVGSTKTVTLSADPGVFGMLAGDSIDIVAATGAAGSGATAADVWTYGTRVLTAGTNLNDISAAEVNAECDTAVAGLATAAALTTVDNEIATLQTTANAIEADTQDIQTQVGTAGAGLTAVPWNASWEAEIQGDVTVALNTYDSPTKTELDTAFTEIKGATWAAGTDTLEHIRNKQTDIETDVATVDTEVGQIKTVTDNIPDNGALTALLASIAGILADTNELQTDDVPGLIAALNNLSTADVNAEVSDVMKTDTVAEHGVAQPPATPTLEEAIMYIYMALRNKIDVSATSKEFHNNAGTVIWKKGLNDDGTTYTESTGQTG